VFDDTGDCKAGNEENFVRITRIYGFESKYSQIHLFTMFSDIIPGKPVNAGVDSLG
jgi:hypothetical protein